MKTVKLVRDQFLRSCNRDHEYEKNKRWTPCSTSSSIKIITGQTTADEFDTVVESWYSAGGQDMTDEVNEWYQAQQ